MYRYLVHRIRVWLLLVLPSSLLLLHRRHGTGTLTAANLQRMKAQELNLACTQLTLPYAR